MKGDGKAHVEEIANLRHVIESQRESFAKAAIKQANQQNEALSQIFSGVQRMVDEQISQLKEANEKQFNSFNAMNISNATFDSPSPEKVLLRKLSTHDFVCFLHPEEEKIYSLEALQQFLH